MENYNHISIGYVCNVASYLLSKRLTSTKSVFDRIGTPMWAVNELFETDFNEMFLEENLKSEKLFTDDKKESWYDEKYYIRFVYNKNYEVFKKIMDKRVEMMKEELENWEEGKNKPIIFIRCEEKDNYEKRGERIYMDKYKLKYEKNELEYLKLFTEIIKRKYPKVIFKVIFLNKMVKDNFYDKEHEIIGIEYPNLDYSDIHVARDMREVFEKNMDFINRYL